MAQLAAVVGIGQTKYQTRRGDVSIAGLVREGVGPDLTVVSVPFTRLGCPGINI